MSAKKCVILSKGCGEPFCGWLAPASHTITPPAFLSCSTLPPIAIRNRQGVKRRVSKRKGCKSKEIEPKRNGFADPSARRHGFGERGAESSSLFAVSQFVVRSSRLHCAAGTAARRVYETRHYLPPPPFPGRGDGGEGEKP